MKAIVSAVINGMIGAVGVLMTVAMNIDGKPITKGVFIGAILTGFFNALKDIQALLQEPPK